MKEIFKKKLLTLFLFLISENLFSYEFEIYKSYTFNETISYWDKWNPVEGGRSGIRQLASWKDVLFVNAATKQDFLEDFFEVNNEKNDLKLINHYTGISMFSRLNDFMIIGNTNENKNLKLYLNSTNLLLPDYDISLEDFNEDNGLLFSFYISDDKLFSLSLNNNLVYWDLGQNGKVIFHNEYELKNYEEKLFEKYGIIFDERTQSYFFGDSAFSGLFPPAYYKYSNDLKIKTKGYENINFKRMFNFKGVDKNGYAYYIAFLNDPSENVLYNNNVDIKLAFAVLDPWTHEVYIIENKAGDLILPRNENGLLTLYSECIDSNGNIYFSDCNINKQQFEIKKFKNDWVINLGLYNREIGRMNSNHIELRKAADSSADFDGYNFEHDYLWILEHGKEWSKVRKIDGREGWVENKYINFNGEKKTVTKPLTKLKVSVNQIMTVNENLRLRKSEVTSSEVITTMQIGTKVKILEVGKYEMIDSIAGNWVKIEVQPGAKDRNGNLITNGTIGWCFGGYLK